MAMLLDWAGRLLSSLGVALLLAGLVLMPNNSVLGQSTQPGPPLDQPGCAQFCLSAGTGCALMMGSCPDSGVECYQQQQPGNCGRCHCLIWDPLQDCFCYY
jgi:hypothetical protein